MKYFIEIETKYTIMPDLYPINTDKYKVDEINEDNIYDVMEERGGDIPFCCAFDEDYDEIYRISIKDENGNIIYETKDENDIFMFWHNEDEDNDWYEWFSERQKEGLTDKFKRDTYEPGFYILILTKEKWTVHNYVVETDDFDIKKLRYLDLPGFLGLYTDSWTTPELLTYDNKILEYNYDDDEVSDYFGSWYYIYEKITDNDGSSWWKFIKDMEM